MWILYFTETFKGTYDILLYFYNQKYNGKMKKEICSCGKLCKRSLRDSGVIGQHSGRHVIGYSTAAGGDCVGICSMLMCEVQK